MRAGNGIALKWTKQGKEENRGRDETGGRNGSGQWYCPEMDEAGKGRTGEGKKREDETGAGNDIALKWTKKGKEENKEGKNRKINGK